jgi:hypothetical protein
MRDGWETRGVWIFRLLGGLIKKVVVIRRTLHNDALHNMYCSEKSRQKG